MEQLILPPSGLVYVDTDIVIYSVEKIEPYSSLLRPMWLAAQAGKIALISSELLLLETLVKPIQNADVILETTFRNLLLTTPEFQLISIDISILDKAAHLRAETGVKTPDAIHAATALLAKCQLFLSNDKGFRRIPDLPVTILNEFIDLG